MIEKISLYFDDSEMSAKEALYAATDAVKHKPMERGAFVHDSKLPNGKELCVESNEGCTQLRIARVPGT